MILYKTDFVEILYHEQHQMVETVWQNFASSKRYRLAMDQYIEVIKTHNVKRWLGDYRLARVIRPIDQEWMVTKWAPAFMPLANGIDKMARVKAQDVAAQISSDNMRQEYDTSRFPFQFRDFEDYDKARAWLLD